MTTIILRKVWGDLAYHKVRSLLAALSIAAGVFGAGAGPWPGALGVMRACIEQDKLPSRPADLTFRGAALGTSLDFHYSVTGVIL